MTQRLKQSERLKSRKAIGRLFAGKSPSIGQYPVRLIYRPIEQRCGDAPVQCAFSVPKRKFPKAVDRNRLRRQLRESWRLRKGTLYQRLPDDAPQYTFILLYVAKEKVPYADIDRAMQGLIKRFLKKHGRRRSKTNRSAG